MSINTHYTLTIPENYPNDNSTTTLSPIQASSDTFSMSSKLLSDITFFRNPNGTEHEWTKTPQRNRADPSKILLAELGYIAVIPFSLVECALSAIAKLFSSGLPLSREQHNMMTDWMNSSSFTIGWSLCNALINVFCNDMIVTEKVARACAASGNFLRVPMQAL